MGGIFISHSSKNSAEAERLRDWLEEQGWGRSQVFLDLTDLKSGDSWRDVLNAMGDKEAVIVCLSNEWLSSHECVREFTQAQERGKPILPIFVAPVTAAIPRFVTDLQIADATKDGFQSLRDSLLARRITPQSFAWPPPNDLSRSVYRGLQALDVQDAAIFFGRDAHITQGLDELRRLRDGAPKRMLVILGASGAGKSSFLRAGLIARLRRDEENFLVLPIVRPERAAISGAQGLAASISAATGARFDPASGAVGLARAFAAARAPTIERLQRHAEAACEAHLAKPPTIVLPIDQAEELFGAENDERAAFCEMLAGAISQDGNALIVATIRSDSYEPMQVESHFASTGQLLLNLPPIPAGSFHTIIEGPARLAQPPLTIEPALTQALLADLDAADALPLLAFTLERLQTQCGADGKLTLGDYQGRLGGLGGAIQSAVTAVLGAQPSKNDFALARRLFVPALVQVDQDGVKRRVARRTDLPAGTHALADQFITQRLLVSDDGEIEVAHEAILRQWSALAGWITEERGALVVLDGVRAAAREWEAPRATGSRQAKMVQDWRDTSRLTHRGARLKEAEAVAAREDLAAAVDSGMREYLAFCRKAERRAAAGQMRMQVLAGVSALAVIGAGYAYLQRETLKPLLFSWTVFRPFAVSNETLRAARPGSIFEDCWSEMTRCPVMVVVPSGRFVMGAADSDTEADADERPSRAASIARFAVSRTEITFGEWKRCVDAGVCGSGPPNNNGWVGEDRPVINISWNEAQEYVTWLSKMTGHDYRLLTEAEWEYAARGVTNPTIHTIYSWGNATPSCDTNSINGAAFNGCPEAGTWPVRSFRPNGFGLYDMHGNVREWVEDCYLPYDPTNVSGAGIPLSTSSGPDQGACTSRVGRGGSWYNSPRILRISNRDNDAPIYRSARLGFRVARTVH